MIIFKQSAQYEKIFPYESPNSILVPCKQVCTRNMKMENSWSQDFINEKLSLVFWRFGECASRLRNFSFQNWIEFWK